MFALKHAPEPFRLSEGKWRAKPELFLLSLCLQWAEKDKGYFRSTWNVLDFVVVVTSLLAATLSSFGWVAGLRLLRVLRPLRLIARSNQMKVRRLLAIVCVSLTLLLHP